MSEILIAQWMPTAECVAPKDHIFSICGLMTDSSLHKTDLQKQQILSIL